MNFLAHAHLANVTQSSITGNLLGDFTKGIDITRLPVSWQLGIKLHRKIDVYTDQHPAIKTCRVELAELRRYGGIIVDIIADHVVAKHFERFHDESLAQFSLKVYRELASEREHLPSRFQEVSGRMIEGNWLESYRQVKSVKLALARTANRLSSKPPLADGLAWYLANPQEIDERLLGFYQSLIDYSQQVYSQLELGANT
ncbi:acyl carrier protein phosphodiesterase [Thalassotalea fusca]